VTTVAVIGLGRMGSRIAGRLLGSGFDVVAWNRSAARCEPLAERGATVAETPKQAAASADAAIVMVSDAEALIDVTEGPEGILGAAGSGTVIQMSTVGIEATRRLAARLGTESLLDAPVLGSVAEADAGTLAIFVGGPDALAERWRPIFEVLGRPIRVGPVGAGSAAKLVANLTLFGVVGLLGEALALADAIGLERRVAFDVLTASPLGAQAERRRPAIESNDYPPRFALSLALKDADLILEASPDLKLRITSAARSWLADAQRADWGASDYASLIAFILGTA
jgi:3-hydroxyisobutyrate dehydrogenase/2-hydroxy-3-oxopropionate reductase